MAEDLDHGLQPGKRGVEEGTLLIKAAFQYDRVEVGVETEHVSKGLVSDDQSGENGSTGCPIVEFVKDTVNQSGDFGEEAAIVPVERAQRLRHGEYELSMWQPEEDLVRQMLGEKDRAFSTARWAEIEALA